MTFAFSVPVFPSGCGLDYQPGHLPLSPLPQPESSEGGDWGPVYSDS